MSGAGLNLTPHARRRMQQRGLRERDIVRVLEIGRSFHQDNGVVVYIDKRAARWLDACEARLARVYVVLARGGGWIVTVGHRTRNLRLH